MFLVVSMMDLYCAGILLLNLKTPGGFVPHRQFDRVRTLMDYHAGIKLNNTSGFY